MANKLPPPGSSGTGTPADATSGDALKGCLSFLVALLVVGGVGEMLYKITPTGAYLFIAVVLLGYASSGGNIDAVSKFFADVAGAK